jgi:hypothetical protein
MADTSIQFKQELLKRKYDRQEAEISNESYTSGNESLYRLRMVRLINMWGYELVAAVYNLRYDGKN